MRPASVNALHDAQQVLMVFRRTLLELAARRSLDRLANRLAKIVLEAKEPTRPNNGQRLASSTMRSRVIQLAVRLFHRSALGPVLVGSSAIRKLMPAQPRPVSGENVDLAP
jgi:hypothetical protein